MIKKILCDHARKKVVKLGSYSITKYYELDLSKQWLWNLLVNLDGFDFVFFRCATATINVERQQPTKDGVDDAAWLLPASRFPAALKLYHLFATKAVDSSRCWSCKAQRQAATTSFDWDSNSNSDSKLQQQ